MTLSLVFLASLEEGDWNVENKSRKKKRKEKEGKKKEKKRKVAKGE
jgi:hypothetical protein